MRYNVHIIGVLYALENYGESEKERLHENTKISIDGIKIQGRGRFEFQAYSLITEKKYTEFADKPIILKKDDRNFLKI